MSAQASESRCEPDLTALLDLVLQMVMFFMLVTNLITNELNPDVKLPNSITAIGLREKEGRLVFINVPYNLNKSGTKAAQVYEVSYSGSPAKTYQSPSDLAKALAERFDSDKVRAEKDKKEN